MKDAKKNRLVRDKCKKGVVPRQILGIHEAKLHPSSMPLLLGDAQRVVDLRLRQPRLSLLLLVVGDAFRVPVVHHRLEPEVDGRLDLLAALAGVVAVARRPGIRVDRVVRLVLALAAAGSRAQLAVLRLIAHLVRHVVRHAARPPVAPTAEEEHQPRHDDAVQAQEQQEKQGGGGGDRDARRRLNT